jgi:hypothetical protein
MKRRRRRRRRKRKRRRSMRRRRGRRKRRRTRRRRKKRRRRRNMRRTGLNVGRVLVRMTPCLGHEDGAAGRGGAAEPGRPLLGAAAVAPLLLG